MNWSWKFNGLKFHNIISEGAFCRECRNAPFVFGEGDVLNEFYEEFRISSLDVTAGIAYYIR